MSLTCSVQGAWPKTSFDEMTMMCMMCECTAVEPFYVSHRADVDGDGTVAAKAEVDDHPHSFIAGAGGCQARRRTERKSCHELRGGMRDSHRGSGFVSPKTRAY